MMETITVPPGSSMVTSELTAPVTIFFTFPLRTFRALIFMVNLCLVTILVYTNLDASKSFATQSSRFSNI